MKFSLSIIVIPCHHFHNVVGSDQLNFSRTSRFRCWRQPISLRRRFMTTSASNERKFTLFNHQESSCLHFSTSLGVIVSSSFSSVSVQFSSKKTSGPNKHIASLDLYVTSLRIFGYEGTLFFFTWFYSDLSLHVFKLIRLFQSYAVCKSIIFHSTCHSNEFFSLPMGHRQPTFPTLWV